MARKSYRTHIFIGVACVSLIAVGGFFLLAGGGLVGLRLWQKERAPQGETELRFRSVAVDFEHQADLELSLPFLAAAAIDMDGDGRDEVFLGGGKAQQDAFLKFDGERFINVSADYPIEKDVNDATMGAASIDLEGDGFADLFVARESGVWLHRNGPTSVTSIKLPFEFESNTVPLSIAIGDVNKDGWADLYISGYINKNKVAGETVFTGDYGGFSYLFVNNGDNTWRDASTEAGVFRQHNTFAAVFADLDNDLDSDLVIAQDTGHVELYENTGAFPMKPIENPSVYSYPMGVAVGDYDNDGLVDLYFSNVGNTLPPALLRGDLPNEAPFNPEYMLFHNEGGLEFRDVARETNTARYGFGWGVVFADMDLDGHEDLLAAQNYARFPVNALLERYPGKLFLYSRNEAKFHPVEKVAGAENRHFGIAPVISDFNGDGWPDLFWANLDDPSIAYISEGLDRNWIKVKLANTARALNAIVTVKTNTGAVLTKQMITSQGLGSDQTRELIFGLGDATGVTEISVRFQDGDVTLIENPSIKQLLDFSKQENSP